MWFPCSPVAGVMCFQSDEAEQIAAQKEAERLDTKRWILLMEEILHHLGLWINHLSTG